MANYAKIVSNCVPHALVNKRFIFLSCLLLLATANSMAMSLGRHSGAALIGRPLDISVQAVLESQDDLASACLDADVFYADNRVDKSRVRVTLEKSVSVPSQALIRIRSSALVDEPVVTVYLRVGCQLKTERRYVTLAELVSESAPDRNTVTPMPPAAPIRPAAIPPVNTGPSAAVVVAPNTDKTDKPVRRSRSRESKADRQTQAGSDPAVDAVPQPLKEQAQTSRAKPQPQPTAAKDGKAPLAAKARLKLEPLDLVIERDPQLKSSTELLSIPAANPQERAAASALWRALSAQPQDILRDTEKLQTLENSVRSLQAQSQQTLLSIGDLNVRLEKAQSERYANVLVYALIAVLLAAVAALAYLLRHRLLVRRSAVGDQPWWRKSETFESQKNAWIDSSPAAERDDFAKRNDERDSSLYPKAKLTLVDVDVDFGIEPTPVKSAGYRSSAVPGFVNSVPFGSKDRPDFGSSMLQPHRALKAEELFDVQQQADFFVSIGQHEQAIELLRSHIAENVETSALVYLDLFNLYHQLKRSEEFESLRLSFNQRFNAQIPTIELYTDQNLGLEAYQHAMSRIQALWPSPKVLDIIEESLFRQPDSNTEPFNLEAYRELLMLYSVAREIISPEGGKVAGKKFGFPERPEDSSDSRQMTFKSTSIQPLSASIDEDRQADDGRSSEPMMVSIIPPASRRLGLDIDLSDMTAMDNKLAPGTVSRGGLLADFDADAHGALPVLDSALVPPAKGAMDIDNLIDFDAFDEPLAESKKPKLPRA